MFSFREISLSQSQNTAANVGITASRLAQTLRVALLRLIDDKDGTVRYQLVSSTDAFDCLASVQTLSKPVVKDAAASAFGWRF